MKNFKNIDIFVIEFGMKTKRLYVQKKITGKMFFLSLLFHLILITCLVKEHKGPSLW